MRHKWPEMRDNQDVTRRGTDIRQQPDSVSEGSDIDIGQQWSVPGHPWPHGGRGHPSEVSRGLLMSPLLTWLIILSPFVPAWARCLSALMISIVMTDAGDHQPVSQLGSHAPCSHSLPGHAWVSSVCLNGLTPRLVTANIGGLCLVCCHRARYLMSSQTEKPITTLYPLQQPLTLACERICYLHFLSVQIILKFKWCGM